MLSYKHSKSLDQTVVHCPIFLTAIPLEFSFCCRTNQANISFKLAKDRRLRKFTLPYLPNPKKS